MFWLNSDLAAVFGVERGDRVVPWVQSVKMIVSLRSSTFHHHAECDKDSAFSSD